MYVRVLLIAASMAITLGVFAMIGFGSGGDDREGSRATRSTPAAPGVSDAGNREGPGQAEVVEHVDWAVVSSADDLAKLSDVVVVGTVAAVGPEEEAPAGAANFARYRDYTVTVEQTLKGEAGSSITVRDVFGHRFGSKLTTLGGLVPTEAGKRYVLFLIQAELGVWTGSAMPWRFALEDGLAVPESGVTSPLRSEAADQFIARIASLSEQFPERVSAREVDVSPQEAVILPKPGRAINLTESLGLNYDTALAIGKGVTFKWEERSGRLEDGAELARLSEALDRNLTIERGPSELPVAGTFPTVTFALTQPVLGLSTVGFIYDFERGVLISQEGIQVRLPADARAILDEMVGVQ